MSKAWSMLLGSIAVVVGLCFLLFMRGKSSPPGEEATELTIYCAAGMRYPMDEIQKRYQEEYGVTVKVQYGGSNTLLEQIKVNRTGDLFLAADDSYIAKAREEGLAAESFDLARMRPVIAVQAGNPLNISSVSDLLREDVRLMIGDPNAAAIGKRTRKLLQPVGVWDALFAKANTKPTVNDVANAVKLGSVDAGIVWDTTTAQYAELEAVRVPELDLGTVSVSLCVLKSTKTPVSAIRFARYISARDRGLVEFQKKNFEVVEGDEWDESPEIVFFAGAVNRRAIEPVIKTFEEREGVTVKPVFNGCGILTGQMRSIGEDKVGFPDSFMACDVYYLKTVQDLFEQGTEVSDTDIVIVVPKGNPKGIESLEDLRNEGVRVAIGQPKQCTIGVLSKRLLEEEGVYDDAFLRDNVVTQTATSAELVPKVSSTNSVDAVLAYRSDTLAEAEMLTVIDIDSPLAKAVQPYSIALSSNQKHLCRRFFDEIARSRGKFESAGFNWRLSNTGSSATPRETDKKTP